MQASHCKGRRAATKNLNTLLANAQFSRLTLGCPVFRYTRCFPQAWQPRKAPLKRGTRSCPSMAHHCATASTGRP